MTSEGSTPNEASASPLQGSENMKEGWEGVRNASGIRVESWGVDMLNILCTQV